MNHCVTTETTTCSYLGTLGCELPGWEEKMTRLSYLEVRVLTGRNSPEEKTEYLSICDSTEGARTVNGQIFLNSCFCDPAFRVTL